MSRHFSSRNYSNRSYRRFSRSRSRSRDRRHSKPRSPPRRRSRSRDRLRYREKPRHEASKYKRSTSPINKRPVLDLSPNLNLDRSKRSEKKPRHSRSKSPQEKKLTLNDRFYDVEKSDGWTKKSSNLRQEAKEISIVIERKLPPDVPTSLEDPVMDFNPDKHVLVIHRRSGEGRKPVFEREEILKFRHDMTKPQEEEKRRVVRIQSYPNVEQKVKRQIKPIREYEERLAPFTIMTSSDSTSGYPNRSFESSSSRNMSDRLVYSSRQRESFRTPNFQVSNSGGLPQFSKRPDKGRVPLDLLDPADTPKHNRYFLHDDRDTHPRRGNFSRPTRYFRRAFFNNLRRQPRNRSREREFRDDSRSSMSKFPNRYGSRYTNRPQRRYKSQMGYSSDRNKSSPLLEWRHDKFEELHHEEPTSSTDKGEVNVNTELQTSQSSTSHQVIPDGSEKNEKDRTVVEKDNNTDHIKSGS